jgi:hypothetical protein
MHKAGLLLIFVLGTSSMFWGLYDVGEADGDHFNLLVGLTKLVAGVVSATLALGFLGVVHAISEQEDRRVRAPPLPGWLTGGRR